MAMKAKAFGITFIGCFTSLLTTTSIAFTMPISSEKLVVLSKNKRAPIIGTIKRKLESGCSSYFAFPGQPKKAVFYELLGSGSSPLINVDGQDTSLTLTRKVKNKLFYKSGDLTVILELFLVKRDYEYNDYKANLTIRRGTKSSTVKLKGGIGC
jgi:hypothetical protein